MKRYIVMILALICLIFSGCGGEQQSSEPVESEPIQSQEPVPSDPVEEVMEQPVEIKFINPLTGLSTEEDLAAKRPVAVMLNNLKVALPQQGNGEADIIYEVVAEGGITRMIGIYQTLENVGTLGSIRSARPYYIEIALAHDALFVHAGGSDQAYEDLESWNVDNIDGVRGTYSYAGAGVFWRERDRIEGEWFDYEHSLVASGETILSAWETSDFPMEHGESYQYEMSFAEDGTPAEGESAEVITVPFSNYKTGVFRYDAEQSVYLVEEYGKAYIDGNTGAQIAVTNVLVLQTEIRNTGDSYGHMEVALSGGSGWFACGGKIIPITWEKDRINGQFRYYTADGAVLTLGQGKSYVNIISDKNEISYE